MRIAFWNIDNNTDLADLLVEFVKNERIDILLLAESQRAKNSSRIIDDVIVDFFKKAKRQRLTRNFVSIDLDSRIKFLSSLKSATIEPKKSLFTSSRWTAYNIKIPNFIEFNLFPVHFYSKISWSEGSLALECANFSRDIEAVEVNTRCENSILIGDFNMNPFEGGVVAANGINAIQDLEYAYNNPQGRKIDGKYYRFFYNPMWNHFGDNSFPLGTIYYRPSGHISHEWNLYDQIIIRPSFKPHLHKDSFKIITEIAGEKLYTDDKFPKRSSFSDHYPILLDLTI